MATGDELLILEIPRRAQSIYGSMLGGPFSGNYPGGTGLTAGAVFGRRAGSPA